MSAFGEAPKCAKCSKSAYANESVKAIGQTWHKTCFACQTCGKGMGSDAGNACDKDGQPFCKACYGKNFGPKGVGFGGTMADTGVGTTANAPAPAAPFAAAPVEASVPMSNARSMFENKAAAAAPALPVRKAAPAASRFGGTPKCAACDKSAYANESVKAIGQSWHKTCFKCTMCSKGMGADAANACDNEGQPYCKACYGKCHGPKGIGFGGAMGDTGIAK